MQPTAAYEVEIAGRRVRYSVRRSRRARRLQMAFDHERGLEVVIPAALGDVDPERFIREHAAWVLPRFEAREASIRERPRARLVDGGHVPLFGQACPLTVGRGSGHAHYEDGVIRASVTDPECRPLVARAVQRCLVHIAAEVFPARVRAWSKTMGVTVRSVRIAHYKTQWGNCSSEGAIALNWKLIMAPPEVMDAVIAHEVAHRVHFSHDDGFRDLMDRHLPAWSQRERWLAAHGHTLTLRTPDLAR